MNKKKIIGIGIIVVVVGVVGYLLMRKKKDNGAGSAGSTGRSAGSDAVTVVNPKLNWIRNKGAASYLSTILDDAKMTSLKNWVSLIEKERAKDSTKWKDSGGLKGQLSDIGHALYQMKTHDKDIVNALKATQ